MQNTGSHSSKSLCNSVPEVKWDKNGYHYCLPVRNFLIFCEVSRNVTRDNHAIDVTQCHTICILHKQIVML